VKLVEDVILILLMQFLLEHHCGSVALSPSLRDYRLKPFHHIDEFIVCQSVLLLILLLLWDKCWKNLSLNLCIVSKNEGVKKILFGSDSSFNFYDLLFCEKSFFFIRPADLVFDLEDGSIYLQK
jgi:hypothetical protein